MMHNLRIVQDMEFPETLCGSESFEMYSWVFKFLMLDWTLKNTKVPLNSVILAMAIQGHGHPRMAIQEN